MTDGSRNETTTNNISITRLIPDLEFTCDGIITQFTVGGAPHTGAQDPKIQVWRESPNRCGAYFKAAPDILLNATACIDGMEVLSNGTFQCQLLEALRIQVQPGDILGLEIPPTDNESFKMYFTHGGPTNYMFPYQLFFAVDLSSVEASEVQEQPQINIIVKISASISTGRLCIHNE